jgi:sialic acid synthase SpsE
MNGCKLNKKVKFIAEIASSHNGSKKNFLKLVNFLVNSSVDIIKIQVFTVGGLAHSSYKFYKTLNKIHLNFKLIEKSLKIILKKKKEVILEPFDEESYSFCKKFRDEVFIKISSSEMDNKIIFKDALYNFRKIFVSVAGNSEKEIKKLFKINSKYKKKIIPTYGFQSFPTDYKNLRLSIIKKIKKLTKNICYADHTTSDSLALNLLTISSSINCGANYIEKHITLDRFKNFPDSDSSLDLNQFDEMLKFFTIIIPEKLKLSSTEKKYSVGMKKYAVIIKNVKKNSNISTKDIKFLRTNLEGINKYDFGKLKNIIATKDISKNEILQKKFFYQK